MNSEISLEDRVAVLETAMRFAIDALDQMAVEQKEWPAGMLRGALVAVFRKAAEAAPQDERARQCLAYARNVIIGPVRDAGD
jgi:hypothetical protein